MAAVSKVRSAVMRIDALSIGRAAMMLGAGRTKKGDLIDPLAGVTMCVALGEQVRQGQPIAILQSRKTAQIGDALELVQNAFEVG